MASWWLSCQKALVITCQLWRGSLRNDTRYGLVAGVYTSDLDRGLWAMREIQAGTVWINRYGRTADFIIPTGGYKQSGIGKDLGRHAFESNLRYKSALIAINHGS